MRNSSATLYHVSRTHSHNSFIINQAGLLSPGIEWRETPRHRCLLRQNQLIPHLFTPILAAELQHASQSWSLLQNHLWRRVIEESILRKNRGVLQSPLLVFLGIVHGSYREVDLVTNPRHPDCNWLEATTMMRVCRVAPQISTACHEGGELRWQVHIFRLGTPISVDSLAVNMHILGIRDFDAWLDMIAKRSKDWIENPRCKTQADCMAWLEM